MSRYNTEEDIGFEKHKDAARASERPVLQEDFVVQQGEIEVFATGAGTVDFRTVGYLKGQWTARTTSIEWRCLWSLHTAAVFFLKMTFAVGVLSIPSSLYTLGLGAGIVNIVLWGACNTCGLENRYSMPC